MYVVNIVAKGEIGQEINLQDIYADIDGYEKEYEPEVYPGLQIRFEDNSVLALYPSGSYAIVGVDNQDKLRTKSQKVLNILNELGVDVSEATDPKVQNVVCKAEIDLDTDLNTFVAELGFENTEYEPEQSPFVYYWPPKHDGMISIPANGEVVITGITEIEEARDILDSVRKKLQLS